MTTSQHSRRDFMNISLLAGGSMLFLSACTPAGTTGGSSKLPPVEGGRVILDASELPTKFAEAPRLARLVKSGKLPPVKERIGANPLAIEPVGEIGKYGGEIRRAYVGVGDFQNAHRFCAGPDSLLYWDYKVKTIVPNIALSYELNSDGRELTLKLRRGMKWSDGKPFTADDIIFWREQINLNKDVSGGSVALRTEGGPTEVRKVDDFTVQFISPVPHPNLPQMMACTTDVGGLSAFGASGGGGFAPRHYLSKFLPEFSSEAQVARNAKEAGFDSWSLYLLNQMDWTQNPKLPLVTPWVPTRPISSPPWTFEANPYSIWVDSEGNQLPYIDKITMRDAGNVETLNLQAIAGSYDFQDRGLPLSSLPVLLKNQERSKYTILRSPNSQLDFTMRVNLAYEKDKTIGDLLRKVEFRRALSLGVDRDQINKTFFLGNSRPTASMVADDSPYFPGREWRTKWATHDTAQANKLLDSIGLTKKDSEGYRLRPDGDERIRLEYVANKSRADFPAMGEMIKRQWKEIGIDMIVENLQPNLIIERIMANELVLQGIAGFTSNVYVKPDPTLPALTVQGTIGIPYAKWFASEGKDGKRPPEELKLEETMNLYQRGLKSKEPERTDIAKEIFKTHADEVWSIGVVGFGLLEYGIYYAKNGLGNVPRRIVNDEQIRTPSNLLPMMFYYK